MLRGLSGACQPFFQYADFSVAAYWLWGSEHRWRLHGISLALQCHFGKTLAMKSMYRVSILSLKRQVTFCEGSSSGPGYLWKEAGLALRARRAERRALFAKGISSAQSPRFTQPENQELNLGWASPSTLKVPPFDCAQLISWHPISVLLCVHMKPFDVFTISNLPLFLLRNIFWILILRNSLPCHYTSALI